MGQRGSGEGAMKRKHRIIRAYADVKRRYWCDVRVFDTDAQMHRDIKRATREHPGKDCAGMVSEAKRRGTGLFAIMWLNVEDLAGKPTEICAHEATHAAIRYFERRGWTTCMALESQMARHEDAERRHEEKLAYAVGRLTRGVVNGLHRIKVFG